MGLNLLHSTKFLRSTKGDEKVQLIFSDTDAYSCVQRMWLPSKRLLVGFQAEIQIPFGAVLGGTNQTHTSTCCGDQLSQESSLFFF